MDWASVITAMTSQVALRKESVDRNLNQCKHTIRPPRSLSARRAWIEILLVYLALIRYLVALRKESVDRNVDQDKDSLTDDVSLSARRAWIEISLPVKKK